jgi:hypothetical protein
MAVIRLILIPTRILATAFVDSRLTYNIIKLYRFVKPLQTLYPLANPRGRFCLRYTDGIETFF